MASAVNFVWNYCNETAIQYLDKKGKWLSAYDMGYLTSGCSKQLNLNSSTIKLVGESFIRNRFIHKKRRLSWRSKKRSLGWIPFKYMSVKGDTFKYNKIKFRFWKSRDIEGDINCGFITQDTQGKWYVSFVCDVPKKIPVKSNREIGIDLGLKTIATLSNGEKLHRENITLKYADRLAVAQRARKKKRVKSIHAKIKNSRKDWNHKETTKLVNEYGTIIIGNVSSSKLKKTRMAKSVSDAGWYNFKTMLAYKANTLGIDYKEINEKFSTVTCSVCFQRTGPSGLSALGVREWTCKCGASHDRDVNAATNILRFGREALINRNALAVA